MNKIKILPQEEAQKIAAGEVVERPSSAIKELIENSIDAKSTQISIYIENAGKKLIRIVDNGTGMSKEDALICFHPHATSKIQKVEDLSCIDSFGFRGEALGSIASISKVTLITQQKDDNLGIKITHENNTITSQEAVSFGHGVDLEIKELFYNIPARKKFLKQDETEWNHILNLVHRLTFTNLNIHFKLYKNGNLILNTPPVAKLKDRISQIFGHNFSENLLPLTTQPKNTAIQLSGFISNHQFWRYNKSHTFFFVNNRIVKNGHLTSALIKGYLNVLPVNKFPAAIIFIEIDKTSIDINVHPRKEEIQFSHPVTVSNTIKKTVKETLEQHISQQISKPHESGELTNFNFNTPFSETPFGGTPSSDTPSSDTPSSDTSFDGTPFGNTPLTKPTPSESSSVTEGSVGEGSMGGEGEIKHGINRSIYTSSFVAESNVKIIGQILQTYILIEQEQSLVIIDQHAAHERILYEQFASNFEQLPGTRLLFPEIIKLDSHLVELVIQESEFFEQIGIQLELFGDNEIAIKSSPPKIRINSLKELILETAHFIEEHEHLEKDIFKKKLTEHTHSHMACKAAIRAGDMLTHKEMLELALTLKKTNNRLICVHGRPTMWAISQNELEKKFKRKQ